MVVNTRGDQQDDLPSGPIAQKFSPLEPRSHSNKSSPHILHPTAQTHIRDVSGTRGFSPFASYAWKPEGPARPGRPLQSCAEEATAGQVPVPELTESLPSAHAARTDQLPPPARAPCGHRPRPRHRRPPPRPPRGKARPTPPPPPLLHRGRAARLLPSRWPPRRCSWSPWRSWSALAPAASMRAQRLPWRRRAPRCAYRTRTLIKICRGGCGFGWVCL